MIKSDKTITENHKERSDMILLNSKLFSRYNLPLILFVFVISSLACTKEEEEEENVPNNIPVNHEDVGNFFNESLFLDKVSADANILVDELTKEMNGESDQYFSSIVSTLNDSFGDDSEKGIKELFNELMSDYTDILFKESYLIANEDPNILIYKPEPSTFCDEMKNKFQTDEEVQDEGDDCIENIQKLDLSFQLTRTSTEDMTISVYTLSGSENMRMTFSSSEMSLSMETSEIIKTSKIIAEEALENNHINGTVVFSLNEDSDGVYSIKLSTSGTFSYSSAISDEPVINYRLPGSNDILKFQIDMNKKKIEYSINLKEKVEFSAKEFSIFNSSGEDNETEKESEMDISIGPFIGSASSSFDPNTSNLDLDFKFGSRFIDIKKDGKDYFVVDGKEGQPFVLNLKSEMQKDSSKSKIELLEEFSFNILYTLNTDNGSEKQYDFMFSLSKGASFISDEEGKISRTGIISLESKSEDIRFSGNLDTCEVEINRTDDDSGLSQKNIDDIVNFCKSTQ